MFTISDELNKKLQEMDFVDYLERMHDWIEGISHRNKSNSAHAECRDLVHNIKVRIVQELNLTWEDYDMKIGKNLRQSAEILDLYDSRESDKKKSARIKEFVDEYTYDLSNFIRAAKRRKENPSTPIEDEEI